jgi:hypothetical protein
MINLGICLKCRTRKRVKPSQFDGESGKIMALAVVDCKISGGELTVDSEIPENCPYYLEHTITQEEAFRMVCDTEETVEEDWGLPEQKIFLPERGTDNESEL